jgi:hypothetical protein
MQDPSSTINTFASVSRNAFLLTSVAVAMFAAASKDRTLWWMRNAAAAVFLVAMWIGYSAHAWFVAYIARVRADKAVLAHPATDVAAWEAYAQQLRAFLYISVVALAAAAYWRE